MSYMDELYKRVQEQKDKQKQDIIDATNKLVEDLNEAWEYEDVCERAFVKKGTHGVIQIMDSMTNTPMNFKIAITVDGVHLYYYDERYKISNWGKGNSNHNISAELIISIYNTLAD